MSLVSRCCIFLRININRRKEEQNKGGGPNLQCQYEGPVRSAHMECLNRGHACSLLSLTSIPLPRCLHAVCNASRWAYRQSTNRVAWCSSRYIMHFACNDIKNSPSYLLKNEVQWNLYVTNYIKIDASRALVSYISLFSHFNL